MVGGRDLLNQSEAELIEAAAHRIEVLGRGVEPLDPTFVGETDEGFLEPRASSSTMATPRLENSLVTAVKARRASGFLSLEGTTRTTRVRLTRPSSRGPSSRSRSSGQLLFKSLSTKLALPGSGRE